MAQRAERSLLPKFFVLGRSARRIYLTDVPVQEHAKFAALTLYAVLSLVSDTERLEGFRATYGTSWAELRAAWESVRAKQAISATNPGGKLGLCTN